MYLDHFKLEEFPFAMTPNTQYYCELPGHQAALNVLLVSLKSGEGFIKIIGEVGTGKTLICRLLMERVDAHCVTAYIHNPDLTPDGLRRQLAKALGLAPAHHLSQQELLDLITEKLLALSQEGKQVVLLVDEAQALSDENLEAIRLLTNLETHSHKLLQVVLFGQPELDDKLNQSSLRQLQQRITFSYTLDKISRRDVHAYVCHRLAKAGYTFGNAFTGKACRLMYRYSQGIPRLINILAHKSLMVAYGQGEAKVRARTIGFAVKDTEIIAQQSHYLHLFGLTLALLLLGSLVYVVLKLYSGLLP